jgi:hypothetical protein
MKTLIGIKMKALLLLLLICTAIACSKGDPLEIDNPEAMDIDTYIKGLIYNPEDLLNAQNIDGLPSKTTEKSEIKVNDPVKGQIETCTKKDFNLKTNFTEIAILRPNNGAIYPGALVGGNGNMLNGIPDPISINRGPMLLNLDLPGIGEEGSILVEEPSNTAVQVELDKALEYWNENNYDGNYTIASQSSSVTSTFFSSEQMSMDLGMNVKWAGNSVSSQLNISSSSQRKVASKVFKQIFYTVTMNTPLAPSSMFRNDVSLAAVQNSFNETNPPAYVSSVSYGRIIMIKIENESSAFSSELEAVLDYASSEGDVDLKYDEILRSSVVTVVTLGGNAEATSELNNITSGENGNGYLRDIITGKNAVYGRDNPGVPISYTIRYLKDNKLAKLGYTTDYTYTDCSSQDFEHASIKVTNDLRTYNAYAKISYSYLDEAGKVKAYESSSWVKIKDESSKTFSFPKGSWNVEIEIERSEGIGGRKNMQTKFFGHVKKRHCFRLFRKSGAGNNIRIEDNECN